MLCLQNLPKAAPKDNSTHGIAVETSRSGGAVARALTLGVSFCQEKTSISLTKMRFTIYSSGQTLETQRVGAILMPSVSLCLSALAPLGLARYESRAPLARRLRDSESLCKTHEANVGGLIGRSEPEC